jgi:hypothetical protein
VRSTDHSAPHYAAFTTPLLPRSSYSSQHPILKHAQPASFLKAGLDVVTQMEVDFDCFIFEFCVNIFEDLEDDGTLFESD